METSEHTREKQTCCTFVSWIWLSFVSTTKQLKDGMRFLLLKKSVTLWRTPVKWNFRRNSRNFLSVHFQLVELHFKEVKFTWWNNKFRWTFFAVYPPSYNTRAIFPCSNASKYDAHTGKSFSFNGCVCEAKHTCTCARSHRHAQPHKCKTNSSQDTQIAHTFTFIIHKNTCAQRSNAQTQIHIHAHYRALSITSACHRRGCKPSFVKQSVCVCVYGGMHVCTLKISCLESIDIYNS